MEQTVAIPPESRALASLTHLSGLSGYIVPLGGIIVPIVIWAMKKDQSPLIGNIAKQAIFLNLIVFGAFIGSAILLLTIILIPLVILFWVVLGLGAIILPIVGAVKANDGQYYRYPVVGVPPPQAAAQ